MHFQPLATCNGYLLFKWYLVLVAEAYQDLPPLAPPVLTSQCEFLVPEYGVIHCLSVPFRVRDEDDHNSYAQNKLHRPTHT